MSFKNTWLLFAGIIVALLVLVFLRPDGPGKREKVIPDLKASKDEISSLEIDRGRPQAEKMVLVRDEKTKRWSMTEPYKARVENGLVDSMVEDVLRLEPEEVSDLSQNLKQMGLEPPAAVVTLKKADGTSWRLNLGNESIGPESSRLVYVNSSSKPKETMAVRRPSIENFYKSPKDLRDRHLLFDSSLNAVSVGLKDDKGQVAVSTSGDNRWKFDAPALGECDYEGENPVGGPDRTGGQHITGVRDLLSAVEGLQVAYKPAEKTGDRPADKPAEKVDDFVKENVTAADFIALGLEPEKPATARIEATWRTGNLLGGDKEKGTMTDTLLIGKKVEVKDKDKDEEKYYARLKSEQNVVRIPAKNVAPILATLHNPSALRNRDLVQFDVPKTDAIDIKNASGELRLRKVGIPAKWKIYDGPNQLRDADQSEVNLLVNALNTKRQVKDFPSDKKTDKELGLDEKERAAEISIWVDGIKEEDRKAAKPEEKQDEKPAEKKDEKAGEKKADKPGEKKEEKKDVVVQVRLKDDNPTVKLIFGKKENDLLYVKREKDKGKDAVRMAVSEGLLPRVTQGRLAFLDKTLPLPPRNLDPVKLVIVHGNKTTELEREKKDAPWKLVKPENLKGRNADAMRVDAILNDLYHLQPVKLVSEKADEAALKRYKLDPPELKIIVTLRKDEKTTEDRVYLFGDKPDPGRLYAKQGEHDLVFEVRPELLETFEKELADLRIFNFEPLKVRQIKLEGWKQVLGVVQTLDFERKDAKEWTVKNKDQLKGFELDGSKVETLVGELSKLAAERFVVLKGPVPPNPMYELSPEKRTLSIEIVLEGEKEPKTLTIGKFLETDNRGYAAQSNVLSGDVFVLPPARFETLLKEVPTKFFGLQANRDPKPEPKPELKPEPKPENP